MIKKILTLTTFLLTIISCAQKQNTTSMDKTKIDSLINSLADQIQKYNKQPYYTLQTNKQNCRILIRVNDLPLWHGFFEDEGESLLLPINDLIPQSGEQTITIEVYPMSTQTVIGNLAHVNVKLIYAPDRNTPMDEFEVLKEWNLPEGLEDKQLSGYELKGTFKAQVPFNFSKELETAKDLSQVPDIEKKVVNKYKQLSKLLEQADGYSFLSERGISLLRSWNYNYFTKNEVLSTPWAENKKFDLSLKGREVHPIENYEIVFYHHNRVVVLRDKTDKSTLLKVYYCDEEVYDQNGEYIDEETRKEYECKNRDDKTFSYSFIALYMPEGSDELKVW